MTTVEPLESDTARESEEQGEPFALLAGEPDDGGQEPHIWRGID